MSIEDIETPTEFDAWIATKDELPPVKELCMIQRIIMLEAQAKILFEQIQILRNKGY